MLNLSSFQIIIKNYCYVILMKTIYQVAMVVN